MNQRLRAAIAGALLTGVLMACLVGGCRLAEDIPSMPSGTDWGPTLSGPVAKMSSVTSEGVVVAGGSQLAHLDRSGKTVWSYHSPGRRILDFWSDEGGGVVLASCEATGGERRLECVLEGKRVWLHTIDNPAYVPAGRVSADGKSAILVEVPVNDPAGTVRVTAVETADGDVLWEKAFPAANLFFAASPSLGRVVLSTLFMGDGTGKPRERVIGLEDGRETFELPVAEQAPFPAFLDEARLVLGAGTSVSLHEWRNVASSTPVWTRPVEWTSDILPLPQGVGVATFSSSEATFTTSYRLFSDTGSVLGTCTLEGGAIYTVLVAPSGKSYVAIPQDLERGGPSLSGSFGGGEPKPFANDVTAATFVDDTLVVGRADGSFKVLPTPN